VFCLDLLLLGLGVKAEMCVTETAFFQQTTTFHSEDFDQNLGKHALKRVKWSE